MNIPTDEIATPRSSGLDDTGKVFFWKNDVYRGIEGRYGKFYTELISSSLWDDLIKLGLIPTEITPYRACGFDLVLKHKKVQVISYATEWGGAMLKDAALLTCDIQLRLMKSDCTLKDAHPWNIIFDACRANFIDLGSISEMSLANFNTFLVDFQATFLYPLLLKRGNATSVTHALMSVYMGFPEMPIYRMLFLMIPLREWLYHYRQRRKIKKTWRNSPVGCVERLRKQIEAIPTDGGKTEWSDYLQGDEVLTAELLESKKMRAVCELLDRCKPRSVLDIGSNKGVYSVLAARKGARVIAIDIDEPSVNYLYHLAKKSNLNILPLHLDFLAPMLTYVPRNIWKSPQKRIRSEMVMMLAITHHLVQKRGSTLHDIAHSLASFTEKLALVEFVGPKDKHVRSWDRIQSPGYSLDSFSKSLGEYFPEVRTYRQIDDDRWLILCSRK